VKRCARRGRRGTDSGFLSKMTRPVLHAGVGAVQTQGRQSRTDARKEAEEVLDLRQVQRKAWVQVEVLD
jgi:hypothetical protein